MWEVGVSAGLGLERPHKLDKLDCRLTGVLIAREARQARKACWSGGLLERFESLARKA